MALVIHSNFYVNISVLLYTKLFTVLVASVIVAWDRKYLETVANRCKIVHMYKYIYVTNYNLFYICHKVLENDLTCLLSLCLFMREENIIKYTSQKHYSNILCYVFVLYITLLNGSLYSYVVSLFTFFSRSFSSWDTYIFLAPFHLSWHLSRVVISHFIVNNDA